MKLGIISDTHMPKRAKLLPKAVIRTFESVDLILHAGDLIDVSVLDELSKIAPVRAVFGNVDEEKVKKYLPNKMVIEINNFKVGLVHGDGIGKDTKTRALEVFEDKMDCIVFGHSHIPYNKIENGVLLFNPGSPTDKRRQKFYSIGIIEVTNKIYGEIIYFESKD